MRIPDFTVTQFGGLNTAIKDIRTLKPGIATDALNWVTAKFGDHIELRRGSALLGQTRQTGSGKITGLGVAIRYDGTEVPLRSRGQKIEYYDATTDDWIETGSNLLGSAADGEDVWFAPYQNLAGSHIFAGSPNSGVYKIPAANPGSAVDQQVNNFRFGFLRFGQGRAFAGQRNGTTAGNADKTGVYLSSIDHALLSAYTQTTGEAYGTGDGMTKIFAHTLAVLSGTHKTAMYVSVTDGTETFTDDRDGNMVGDKGGTGTVNYATGAVSVTFNTAPANSQAITCSYYTEDATAVGGPLDFDTSNTGSGKPKIFRQDDGGASLMAILPFMEVEYCLHKLRTWALTTTINDTAATNLPYRNVGIPYPRAACEEPEGILLIDTSNPNEPKIRRLEIGRNTNNLTIVPTSLSDALDLSVHAFDYAVAFRWGDYEIICCQEYVNGTANGYNSVMYVHNVVSGAWDKLSYGASALGIYDGALIAGDAISNNVYTLFSGYDDDEDVIDNHWQDGLQNLGTENLKRVHLMNVTGLIQKDQSIDVYLVLDTGEPVKVFTISGDGSYVDSGINTTIGSPILGSKVLGDGGSDTAHPFDVTFEVHTDRFQYVSTRFEATAVGYAEIDSYTYKDIRDKGRRALPTTKA
jgi:hypothetical protein